MKLSNDTLSILKNFATINSGIEFKTGSSLATMSSGKTVLAKATIKDEFPQDFCVYDLNQFLSVYSINKDPEIDFDEFNVIFKTQRSKTRYRKTAKHMIVTAPDKSLNIGEPDVAFTLSQEDYRDIIDSAKVLQSPHIAVESTGDKIVLTCYNAKDDSAHTNSIEVAEGNGNSFKVVFLTENIKMITGSYDVEISFKGFTSFKNKVSNIQYWIASEAKESNYGG